ncbi:MAG TPA: hypothetical protein VEQ41_06900 [Solirubrobacterales bacterium]|nr:hypothetical protein [Solirubrobacterales bacterium]
MAEFHEALLRQQQMHHARTARPPLPNVRRRRPLMAAALTSDFLLLMHDGARGVPQTRLVQAVEKRTVGSDRAGR